MERFTSAVYALPAEHRAYLEARWDTVERKMLWSERSSTFGGYPRAWWYSLRSAIAYQLRRVLRRMERERGHGRYTIEDFNEALDADRDERRDFANLSSSALGTWDKFALRNLVVLGDDALSFDPGTAMYTHLVQFGEVVDSINKKIDTLDTLTRNETAANERLESENEAMRRALRVRASTHRQLANASTGKRPSLSTARPSGDR